MRSRERIACQVRDAWVHDDGGARGESPLRVGENRGPAVVLETQGRRKRSRPVCGRDSDRALGASGSADRPARRSRPRAFRRDRSPARRAAERNRLAMRDRAARRLAPARRTPGAAERFADSGRRATVAENEPSGRATALSGVSPPSIRTRAPGSALPDSLTARPQSAAGNGIELRTRRRGDSSGREARRPRPCADDCPRDPSPRPTPRAVARYAREACARGRSEISRRSRTAEIAIACPPVSVVEPNRRSVHARRVDRLRESQPRNRRDRQRRRAVRRIRRDDLRSHRVDRERPTLKTAVFPAAPVARTLIVLSPSRSFRPATGSASRRFPRASPLTVTSRRPAERDPVTSTSRDRSRAAGKRSTGERRSLVVAREGDGSRRRVPRPIQRRHRDPVGTWGERDRGWKRPRRRPPGRR